MHNLLSAKRGLKLMHSHLGNLSSITLQFEWYSNRVTLLYKKFEVGTGNVIFPFPKIKIDLSYLL